MNAVACKKMEQLQQNVRITQWRIFWNMQNPALMGASHVPEYDDVSQRSLQYKTPIHSYFSSKQVDIAVLRSGSSDRPVECVAHSQSLSREIPRKHEAFAKVT